MAYRKNIKPFRQRVRRETRLESISISRERFKKIVPKRVTWQLKVTIRLLVIVYIMIKDSHPLSASRQPNVLSALYCI